MAHDVFTPGIDRKDLLGSGNSADEIALPARLGDELQQPREKSVAVPLALGEDPLVVERGQQVAAIEANGLLDPLRIGDEPVELLDVEPQAQVVAQAHAVAVDDERSSFQLRRQNASQIVEAHAQLGARGSSSSSGHMTYARKSRAMGASRLSSR